MRGQALVPLAGPLLRDGLHEVPLQLADAGMMPEQVLLRLIEFLYGGESRKQGAGGAEAGGGGKWIKKTIRGGKIRNEDGGSWMGRERKDDGFVRSWERITNREKTVRLCFFLLF